MGNSPLVTYTKLSPHYTPRTHKIDTISIHCVVGQLTAKAICNLDRFDLDDPDNDDASCNYAIGCDGSIGLCVEEKNRSWCTSSRSNDNRAITIEVASDTTHPYAVTPAAYKALIDLLVDICIRNKGIGTLKWKGDKSLIGQTDKQNMTVHRWFKNKACPGEYLYSRHAQIAAEVNERLGYYEEAPSKSETAEQSSYSLKEFIKDIQMATGAKVDGIAGPETLSKTVTLSAVLNRKHPTVYYVQRRLKVLGYSEVGAIDGIAGSKFTAAVKHFQTDNGCVADGEITARNKTWKKLLGLG